MLKSANVAIVNLASLPPPDEHKQSAGPDAESTAAAKGGGAEAAADAGAAAGAAARAKAAEAVPHKGPSALMKKLQVGGHEVCSGAAPRVVGPLGNNQGVIQGSDILANSPSPPSSSPRRAPPWRLGSGRGRAPSSPGTG